MKYNQQYILIDGGDIILQGLHADTIFFGAWDEIYSELEREFWSSDFCQVRSLADFISYEEENRIIFYLNDHAKDGKVIAHYVN